MDLYECTKQDKKQSKYVVYGDLVSKNTLSAQT